MPCAALAQDPRAGWPDRTAWEGPGEAAAGALAVHPLLSRGRDLDGDGAQELVEIYTRTPESGPFTVYVVVWPGWGQNGPRSAPVGQNVQIVDLRLAPGRIEMQLLQVGPQDEEWAPTEWVSSVWAYEGGPPRLVDATLRGPVSPAFLAGTRWRWVGDGVVNLQITGATMVIDGTGVRGSTGCGQWEGRITTSGFPGEFAIAARPLSSGRCGEAASLQEEAFLYRLATTDRLTFEMGRLVLYDSRDPWTRAVFEPATPPPPLTRR